MNRIRKGDRVIITTGRDKGRQGTIVQVLDNGRLLVEGINLVTKHQKGNPQTGTTGGIIKREASIHASNVMLFNAQTNKADRVGFRTLDDGRKVRFFKSNGEVLDA